MITSDVNILVIGDPHFKVSGVPEHDKMCKSIIENAKNRKVDLIVVLGDILDRHETIHVSPLTRSIKFLGELIKIAPINVLIGNHDLKNNKQFLSEEHGFTSFKLLHDLYLENLNNILNLNDSKLDDDIIKKIIDSRKITFVDKVMSLNIRSQTFIFAPYVPPGRFQEALDTINFNDFNNVSCIFAHQEFKGAQMGAITSVEGDTWSVNNPYIISGHIHDYQNLQENILYVGTPIQHSFGDNPNKTISYFSFKSNSVRTEELINLGLPRKATVRITSDQVDKYVPPVNSNLRITILGNHESLKSIMNHPNVINWKKLGHKITTKDVPINNINNTSEEIIIKTAPPKFSVALQKSIENDPQLQELYCNIFGKKKEEIKVIVKPKMPLKLKIVK